MGSVGMRCKDFIVAAFICVAVVTGFLALVLFTGDCDLFLWAADHFGSPPAVLSGQVVWITGASSGIGEHLAYVLAAAGCRLVLSARREQELQRVKQNCIDNYGIQSEDVLILPLDVLKLESHQEAVETILKHFKQIDILVNNAGRGQRALCLNTSLDVDRELLEVNTLGPLSLTKAVLPHMVSRHRGHIAVVSSLAGKLGAPGLGSYAGSKHALHGWFDTLRMEMFEDNIHVTILCPGPVYSDILKFAYKEKPGQTLGGNMTGEHRMSTERCAYLSAVAIANQLDEAWISLNPELSYVYLNQYFPAAIKWLTVRVAGERLKKIKEGKMDLHY